MAPWVTSGAVDAAASGAVQPALKSAQDQRHKKDPSRTLPATVGSTLGDRTASRHLDMIGAVVDTTLMRGPVGRCSAR
jgi:hypothetical protein